MSTENDDVRSNSEASDNQANNQPNIQPNNQVYGQASMQMQYVPVVESGSHHFIRGGAQEYNQDTGLGREENEAARENKSFQENQQQQQRQLQSTMEQQVQSQSASHSRKAPPRRSDSPATVRKRQAAMNDIGMGKMRQLADEEYDPYRMQFGNGSDSTDSESDYASDYESDSEESNTVGKLKGGKVSNIAKHLGIEKKSWILSGLMERFAAAQLKKGDHPPEDWALRVRPDKVWSGGDEKKSMKTARKMGEGVNRKAKVHKMYMGTDIVQAPDGFMEVQME
jgi:hypothetical protein